MLSRFNTKKVIVNGFIMVSVMGMLMGTPNVAAASTPATGLTVELRNRVGKLLQSVLDGEYNMFTFTHTRTFYNKVSEPTETSKIMVFGSNDDGTPNEVLVEEETEDIQFYFLSTEESVPGAKRLEELNLDATVFIAEVKNSSNVRDYLTIREAYELYNEKQIRNMDIDNSPQWLCMPYEEREKMTNSDSDDEAIYEVSPSVSK